MIKVFPTGHVGVFLVGGMIVKFLNTFYRGGDSLAEYDIRPSQVEEMSRTL